MGRLWLRYAILGPVFPRPIRPRFSGTADRPTARSRARRAEPVSVCLSLSASSRCTAGGSGSNPNPAGDRRSASRCRCEAMSFIEATYKFGWVLWPEFDWIEWKHTPEAMQLRDGPEALSKATPEQLARLLTVLIRQDRFVESALQSAFESGILTRV